MKATIGIEDDFLFKVYQKEKSGIAEVYPKVTSIPKGKRITPDIDLLLINKYKSPELILGLELKLLRKTDLLQNFYLGLGEAICYFQHGADQVRLILGCFNMNSQELNQVENKLRKVCNFLEQINFSSFHPYLGIDIYREDKDYPISLMELSSNARFPVHSYKEINHKRNCLLNGEFEWGKRWIKNREKSLVKEK